MRNKYKNIIVVVDSIDIDDSSGSKVNVALIYNLHKIGHTVKVLHYTRKEIQLKGIECISIREIKLSVNYVLSRTQRVLQRLFKVNFSKFLENIFGHSFTFFNDSKSISKAIRKFYSKEDLLITLSKGASFRPHHAMLSKPKLHEKWMAYVHDPYPFHCYPHPYDWVESGAKYKERFFRQVSEKARYAAFPSQLLKEWMGNYFPNLLKTGVIIPHQSINTESEIFEIPNYFDITKFTILHAGNLMKQRSPKGLIDGFKLFLMNNLQVKDNARLLLVGSSNYHKDMLDMYNSKIPELYISNGNVSFEIVYYLQKNASINVILESKAEISPFLPGKFPHCVLADKPILLLSPVKSETKRLLGADYKYHTKVDDVNKIAKLIQELYEQWQTNPQDLKLNRKDLEHYVSENYLEEVINSLT